MISYSQVRPESEAHARFLFELLKERPKYANISHRKMPSWMNHLAFISSDPYLEWWVMLAGGAFVGAIYLSKSFEIGIAVKREYRHRGYASEAIRWMLERHKGKRLLANIAPNNLPSRQLFEGLGFKKIQETYARS